jgi:multiple sugar transport system permease protein
MVDWIDRNSKNIFILPSVILILIFSVFPLVSSLIFALTRIRPRAGGYNIRFVGTKNFEKLFFGSDQFHLLGTIGSMSILSYIFLGVLIVLIGIWVRKYFQGKVTVVGIIGRAISISVFFGIGLLLATTLLIGNNFGTLITTLIYVLFGCSIQFLIGLILAYICYMPFKGRAFFRILFFIPLMITPVGIAYQWRMLADMNKGPFSELWNWVGLGEFAWGSDPWAARTMVMLADAWMWIPFMFIVMLSAIETVSDDLIEAAEVDGASKWMVFTDVIWPQIAPVAGTVVLIRWIEGFKLIDIPNVLTHGGPGIATETMTMHSWSLWKALNFSSSAAIAYTLLFVSVVICVSFFNFVIRRSQAPV